MIVTVILVLAFKRPCVGTSSLNLALFQQQVAASPHSPSLRALDTTLAADLLMTWTTYSGQLTAWAMVMARWVASASTSSGRHSSWPSGPVMPRDSIFLAPCRVPAGMGTTSQHKGYRRWMDNNGRVQAEREQTLTNTAMITRSMQCFKNTCALLTLALPPHCLGSHRSQSCKPGSHCKNKQLFP